MHIYSKKYTFLKILMIFLLFVSGLFLAYISADEVIRYYYLHEKIFLPETLNMMAESGILFLVLLLCSCIFRKTSARYSIYAAVVSVFLWLHRAFLPVLVSGVFIICLIMLGEIVLSGGRRFIGIRASDDILRILHDFISGALIYITSICLLSLFKIGSMRDIYIYTVCLFLCVLFIYILLNKTGSIPLRIIDDKDTDKSGTAEDEYIGKKKKPVLPKVFDTFLVCLILTMLLLQAGRLNIAIDYDSLHYGLRTPYILNNGLGIYEKLGLVNDVYYYPKGLEILTMPLNIPVSYGFILAFSWWTLVAVIVVIYDIVKKLANPYYAFFAAALTAFVPGITNMGVSAKTDIITLLIQLVFVDDVISCIKKREEASNKSAVIKHLVWAFSLIVSSLIFKPTSVVFSGLLFITGLIFAVYIKFNSRKNIKTSTLNNIENKKKTYKKKSNIKSNLSIILPAFFSLILVTLRTFIMTGYPITSAYSIFWRKLGISSYYPFSFEGHYCTGTNTDGFYEKINIAQRLRGLFISPVGEDMIHVFIAFGGVLMLILIVLGFICGIISHKKLDAPALYINFVCIVLLLASLFILEIVYQVDGNYFMLVYALIIIAASNLACAFFDTSKFGQFRTGITVSLLPVFTWAFVVTCVTNWAGAYGFTPISFMHIGFYNHYNAEYKEMEEAGLVRIFDYLNKYPRARVVSMAYQPEGLCFKCCIQSYTDIVGSGGNSRLVHKLYKFKDYLDFVGVEYVYTNRVFLDEHERASDIEEYMVEDGSLIPLIRAGDNTLYRYERKE